LADDEKRSRKKAVHPLEAKLDRLFGESAALTAGHEVSLPEAKAPALADLHVQVLAPDPVTAEDLMGRLHELLRAKAPRRDRAAGEPVALGDEIQVDVLGYAHGALIPGSVRVGAWMDLEPMPHLPGFAETVAGTRVGDGCALDLDLPDDYPVAQLAGAQARFLVEVRGARELSPMDPEAPSTLAALGLGATLDEALAAVTTQVDEERVALQALEVQDAVLDRLAELTEVALPDALVDEEIRRGWTTHEAPLLAQKGLQPDEQAEALDAWLRSDQLRAEAEKRLRVSLALEAVARRDGLALTDDAVRDTLEAVAEELGLTLPDAARAVDEDPALAARVAQVARHLMLVTHVVQAAQVEVTEEPP
jgi:trigger factor